MNAVKDKYFDEVKGILMDVGLEPSSITPDAHLSRDLGLDSLDLADIVMRLEVEFNIRVQDTDAEKLATVNDVLNYLDTRMAS